MSTVPPLSEIAETIAALPSLPDDLPVTPEHASRILRALGRVYSPATLRKLRCVSTCGPRFEKAPNGRVTYKVGDLRTFVA